MRSIAALRELSPALNATVVIAVVTAASDVARSSKELGTALSGYAECYPGQDEMADAIDDSDDEADYSKMDMVSVRLRADRAYFGLAFNSKLHVALFSECCLRPGQVLRSTVVVCSMSVIPRTFTSGSASICLSVSDRNNSV